MGLPYRGPLSASGKDIGYRAYLQSLLDTNLSQSEINSLLTSGFAANALKTYVDNRDALNATKAFIDAGDDTKLKLAQKEVNNGIAGLGSTSRVNVARINMASTQRWPKPFISPASYGSANATTTEVQMGDPIPVADPGFTYKLLVFGRWDATLAVDGEFPVIRVRQGSSSGQLVGVGAGLAEYYTGGVVTYFTTAGGHGYSIPSWATSMDVGLIGGGGGGAGGNAFNADGNAGGVGQVVGVSIVRGVDIPLGTNTITITVGAGGAAGGVDNGSGGAGQATTATAAGWVGATAAGGVAGAGLNGAFGTGYIGRGTGSPLVFNGHTYQGSLDQVVLGQPGYAPGGGGAGGDGMIFASAPGGAGAVGGAAVLAYPDPNFTIGQVTIIPSAVNAQSAITGATNVYVMVARSGSTGTAAAATINRKLMVIPVPA